jgi:hypothetical protein
MLHPYKSTGIGMDMGYQSLSIERTRTVQRGWM